MIRMFKYEIENELKALYPIELCAFKSYLGKLTLDQNKIIFFGNTSTKYYSYYCTYCQKWHFIEKRNSHKFKKGEFLTCGNCQNRFEVIYSHNVIATKEKYIVKIEVNHRNEVIFRVFFYKKRYIKKYGEFIESFYEVERINFDRKIAMKCNSYRVIGGYGIYHGPTEGWVRDRTEFYKYYFFNNIVNKNIKRLLKSTSLRYSAVEIAIKMGVDMLDYLVTWKHNQKIELLAKAGCSKFLADICRPGIYEYYKMHSIFEALSKKQINLLRKYNLNLKEIQVSIEAKIEDVDYIKKAVAVGLDSKRAKKYKDIYKVLDYLKDKKYSERDYYDYLEWCSLLGMNMEDKKVLYPSDPRESHDKAFKKKKALEDAIFDKKIKEYSEELEKVTFKSKRYIIRPARSQKELIEESKHLSHCVRTYAEKMASRRTSIFFIRNLREIEEPFVTLELNGDRVIQCRAKKNQKPNNSVVKFVNKWCQKNHFQSCFN